MERSLALAFIDLQKNLTDERRAWVGTSTIIEAKHCIERGPWDVKLDVRPYEEE